MPEARLAGSVNLISEINDKNGCLHMVFRFCHSNEDNRNAHHDDNYTVLIKTIVLLTKIEQENIALQYINNALTAFLKKKNLVRI